MWDAKSLLETTAQTGQRRVGVAERLEIDEELVNRTSSLGVECDAVVDLLGDAVSAVAITGCKRLVQAEGATANTHRPVTVWAGEPGIHRQLAYLMAEGVLQILVITVVWQLTTPGIWHYSSLYNKLSPKGSKVCNVFLSGCTKNMKFSFLSSLLMVPVTM